jgi:ribosomal subunit interface protein
MRIPLQVTFKDIPSSPALEDRIREKAEKLHRFYDGIIGCHVVVELVQKHPQQGKRYNIRIDLTVPGAEIVANRDEHEDPYGAVREAFEAAARQLEDYARARRGDVKRHSRPAEPTA